MLRSRFFVVILISCLWSAGCQSPQPEISPLEFETPPFVSPVLSPEQLGNGWQTWRADIQPDAAYTVAITGTTLWAGTSFGVARLDLHTGTYNRYEEVGKTYLILPMENGQVLAASVNGIFYFNGEKWRRLEFVEPFSYYSNGVFVLAIDQAGNLWLQGSTYRSVYYTHFQGHIPPATGLWRDAGDQAWPSPDWSVCGVWRSLTDGRRYSYLSLNQCVQQKAARAQIYDSLPARDRDLTSVVVDADRSIWWAYAKTLGHVSNSQSITLELPGTYAYSLAADPAHGVWIATGQGLAYSDGTTIQQPLLDLNSHTFHGTPLDIAVDAQSVVWVNLQENGEVKSYSVANPKWRHVMNDAVNVRGIRSIAAAPEGGFWATRGWDLWRSNDPIDLRPVTAAAPPCPLRHLVVDRNGHVWSPSRECGALEYIPKSNQWLQHQPDASIEAMTIDKNGRIYALGQNGIYVSLTTSQAVSNWQMAVSLQDKGSALLFVVDEQGGLWLASRETGKLWHYANGKETALGQQFQSQALSALYANDRLWAIDQNTLALYADRAWRHIPTPAIGNIIKLAGESDGRIWLIGQRGIAVYDPAHNK